ncbi:MmcQ/YjbR family DNA-binding protein [Paraliomyxa miuraensis]|uniref:MmcQ/YjbR family DNA-binding protein n=1 Tax=Paraliomyxa miuraensis TaxID=376150 RepID=UPI0022530811|nr:MmcQ/YjbR family DNA-binding protein [Paraliomyxa miuraensis]MCX4240984.1 MmcQ/YjbR family DNA-binding protein [Paraliomyxa miuraensis]
MALSLPGAWEDHPWGESVAKVGKKVFVFFGMSDDAQLREGLGMSVKLPRTGDLVLALPFAEPTGYGLGRAGWVTVRIPAAELPPPSVLVAWIEESYRAVAPKTKIAELDARGPVLAST